MASLYETPPSVEKLALAGLVPSDLPEPAPIELWESVVDVFSLYSLYSTQWRVSMSGLVGLDYNVFHHALDRKKITAEEYDRYLFDLKAIERSVIELLSNRQ